MTVSAQYVYLLRATAGCPASIDARDDNRALYRQASVPMMLMMLTVPMMSRPALLPLPMLPRRLAAGS